MLKNYPVFINESRLRRIRSYCYKNPIYRFGYSLMNFKVKLFGHVLIQTNNRCTRKCYFCWHGIKGVGIPDDEMPQWLFLKIIDELAALNYSGRISLFEMNEPLTDPLIFERIKYVKEKVPRAWQMLTTNGDLLNEERAVKLFKSGLDYLNISAYSETDYLKFKTLRSKLPKEVSRRIANQLTTSKDITDNRGGNLPSVETVEKPLKEPCSRINHILYIKPNGNIVSCFGDYNNVNFMGNVKEQGLLDVWFGEKFENLRKNLNQGKRGISKLCQKCNIGAGTYFVTRKNQEKWLKKNIAYVGVIIGSSQSARLFFPYLKKFSTIKAVVSKNNIKDPYFIRRSIPLANNLQSILSDVKTDFVFIANRNCDHYSSAKEALLSHKHVLIDKPMTIKARELDDLIEIAHSRNLLIGGIFQWRFLTMADLAKQWIKEGRFGELLFINTRLLWRRDLDYYIRGRGTWSVDGGGVLIKQAIHCLDIMLYLGGEPLGWDGWCANQAFGLETEDSSIVSLRFKKGLGSLISTVNYAKEIKPQIEIIGTNGRLVFNIRDEIEFWGLPFKRPSLRLRKNILAEQIRNFIEAIDDHSKLLVTPEECRKSLLIIEDVYKKWMIDK